VLLGYPKSPPLPGSLLSARCCQGIFATGKNATNVPPYSIPIHCDRFVTRIRCPSDIANVLNYPERDLTVTWQKKIWGNTASCAAEVMYQMSQRHRECSELSRARSRRDLEEEHSGKYRVLCSGSHNSLPHNVTQVAQILVGFRRVSRTHKSPPYHIPFPFSFRFQH